MRLCFSKKETYYKRNNGSYAHHLWLTIASGEDQVQVVVVIGEGGTQDRVAMWAEEHPGSQDRVVVAEHP